MCKVQVLRIVRSTIEEHDGLQHTVRRHPHVFARLVDVALARSCAECSDQQVADPAARLECSIAQIVRGIRGGEVVRVLVVGEEAEEIVLVDPHIPVRPAAAGNVRAQVAVRLLRLKQAPNHSVQLDL